MNWIRFLANKLSAADRVIVFSHDAPAEMKTFEPGSPVIRIKRFRHTAGGTAISRYAAYIKFYASVIRQLARFKPDTVLYYESLSALPALFYKRFLRPDSRLLVHYHEYTSPEEYRNSMLINFRAHLLEKRMYPRFAAVSHTNSVRAEMFRRDNLGIKLPDQIVWPNYPPQSWTRPAIVRPTTGPVRFVYVGALDLKTMYVQAFADWILRQQDKACWTIYSYNCTAETRRFLAGLNADSIRFHEGVAYDELPGVLGCFNVGVILYKGHIPNYIYNAPNKLFEYWSCGLDVWFPVQMTGGRPFISTDTSPRITAIDFDAPETWPDSQTDRSGFSPRPSPYTSETEAEVFFKQLIQ